jgi:hypothetical protein
MKNFSWLVLMAALVVGVLATPRPVAAAYTGNLAGRPVSGWATSPDDINDVGCAGIAYANVNGKMGLLGAAHCKRFNDPNDNPDMGYQDIPDGTRVNGPNGQVIGEWAPIHNNTDKHDPNVHQALRRQLALGTKPGVPRRCHWRRLVDYYGKHSGCTQVQRAR